MSEHPRWGKLIEKDGWQFYGHRVAINADKTIVVVNGRQFFALEVEAVERRKTVERTSDLIAKLQPNPNPSEEFHAAVSENVAARIAGSMRRAQ